MGTGRKFNKKPATRPKKTGTDRMRRDNNHKKRLLELGVDKDVIKHLNQGEIRDLLQRPEKTKKGLASASKK